MYKNSSIAKENAKKNSNAHFPVSKFFILKVQHKKFGTSDGSVYLGVFTLIMISCVRIISIVMFIFQLRSYMIFTLILLTFKGM